MGSAVGAQFGVRVGERLPAEQLRALLAALLILLPPLDTIGDLPGYVADATGVALAVIVLAPRIMKALAAPTERQPA